MRPSPDWVQAELYEDQSLWRRHVNLLRELSPKVVSELDEFTPKPDPHWSTPPVKNSAVQLVQKTTLPFLAVHPIVLAETSDFGGEYCGDYVCINCYCNVIK